MESKNYKEYHITKLQKDKSNPVRRVKTKNIVKAVNDFADQDTEEMIIVLVREYVPEDEAQRYNRLMGWEE